MTIFSSVLNGLPKASAFILVTVLTWQAGVLVSGMAEQKVKTELSSTNLQSWLLAGQKPMPILPNLAYEQLFKQKEKVVSVAEAPKTALNMVLKAVFVAPDSKDSGAIIASLQNSTRYYRVGDTIELGITLQDVQDEYVVLNRKGQKEILGFRRDEEKPFFEAVQSTVSKRETSVSPASADEVPAALDALPETELGDDVRNLSPNAFVRKYQARLSADPETVLQEAGLSRAPGGGYQIENSPYAALLMSAGLQPGDVLLSVNGNSLGDPAADAQIAESVIRSKTAEILIRRGSREFAVTLPVGR